MAIRIAVDEDPEREGNERGREGEQVKKKDGCNGRRKDVNREQKYEEMKEKTKKKQDGEEDVREQEK